MAGGLLDLELLMDNNLRRASIAPPLPTSASLASVRAAGPDLDAHATGPWGHDVAASSGNPLPSAATISLALNTVFVSGLVRTKNSVMTQASHRDVVGPTPSRAAQSLTKSKRPMPVVASSRVQVVLDVSVETTAARKSANYVSAFPEYERLPGPGFKDPANAAGLRQASIVWFRNDLRVHDNEALVSASSESSSVLPVYCFDPRDYGKSSSGFDKTGPCRAKFLLECVTSLRSSLRDRGSDLVVRIGKPEEVLVDLVKSVRAQALYVHQEVTHDELRAEEKVSAALQHEGVETKYFWGSTLFHPEDLPFKLEDMPSNYGGFRAKLQGLGIRETIEAPGQLKGLPATGAVNSGRIPSLVELGVKAPADLPQESRAAGEAEVVGGEEKALKRLQEFAVDMANQIRKSKASRSQAEPSSDSVRGANFSCKISPWLALGCLSPRRMFEDMKKSASSVGALSTAAMAASEIGSEDNGLKWLVFELLWRDFFRFITRKYGTGKKTSEATPANARPASLIAA